MDLLRRFVLRERSGRERLVIVVVAVSTAAVIRALLTPALGDAIPWVTFVMAVQVTAVLGGAAAGALAVLLSLLIGDLAFMHPRWTLALGTPSNLVSAVAFATVASLIAAVGAFMQRAF